MSGYHCCNSLSDNLGLQQADVSGPHLTLCFTVLYGFLSNVPQ